MTPSTQRLSTLLDGAGITPLEPVRADPWIQGVTLDSRRADDGFLFFALPGLEQDGEKFIPDAVGRGATAVLARSVRPDWLAQDVAWIRVAEPRRAAGLLSRECHGRPDEELTLVGITGTNGKTTVSYLVESMAKAAGRRAGRIGTVGYAFADQQIPAARTTPEAPELFALLREMRGADVELVAMEVSSHALALSRTAGARFQTAAFLNLTRDHLDFHGDDESYFEAKAQLFDELTAEAWAVLPADSDYGRRLAGRTAARVRTFGRQRGADVMLIDEQCTMHGSTARLVTADHELAVATKLLGAFNLDNIAAAAACGFALGLPAAAIALGVEQLERVPGRTEPVNCGQPFGVIVDYAHTDDALSGVLTAMRKLTQGELSVVFGCGGNRDQGKRAEMGRVAAQLADRVWVTSDNPRREDPQAIIDDIVSGIRAAARPALRWEQIVDRRQAIHHAIANANAGDLVLLAGKGHETTVTHADRVETLDDRIVAAEALQSRGFAGGCDA